MADHTGIEWTDATWNPVTGCAKVLDGEVWQQLPSPHLDHTASAVPTPQ